MNWLERTYQKILHQSASKRMQRQLIALLFVINAIILTVYFLDNIYHNYTPILLTVSVVLIILFFTFPIVFRPLLFVWLFIGRIIGEITSTVVLSVIYFIFIVPMNWFRKKTTPPKGWVNSKNSDNFDEQF